MSFLVRLHLDIVTKVSASRINCWQNSVLIVIWVIYGMCCVGWLRHLFFRNKIHIIFGVHFCHVGSKIWERQPTGMARLQSVMPCTVLLLQLLLSFLFLDRVSSLPSWSGSPCVAYGHCERLSKVFLFPKCIDYCSQCLVNGVLKIKYRAWCLLHESSTKWATSLGPQGDKSDK